MKKYRKKEKCIMQLCRSSGSVRSPWKAWTNSHLTTGPQGRLIYILTVFIWLLLLLAVCLSINMGPKGQLIQSCRTHTHTHTHMYIHTWPALLWLLCPSDQNMRCGELFCILIATQHFLRSYTHTHTCTHIYAHKTNEGNCMPYPVL